MNDENTARLYLCATPIGNLEDITLRVMRVLNEVDAVYCEDTRNTMRLLNHFGIKKPVYSCHEHNEEQRAHELADAVRRGKSVAFVSDAGMPAVSDPGSRLVRVFAEQNLPFEVLPGASAMITAWVMSALPTERLYFCGFLPRNGAKRKSAIEVLRTMPATSVLYESPLRVGKTLEELYNTLGDRPCALVREITKTFEQTVRGSLSELSERYRDDPPKGECVLVIGEAPPNAEDMKAAEKLDGLCALALECGTSVKDAARIASFALGTGKNEAYKAAMQAKECGE